MRLACPSCSSLYDLPEGFFAGGEPDVLPAARKVRCHACGTVFVASVPESSASVVHVPGRSTGDSTGEARADPDAPAAPRAGPRRRASALIPVVLGVLPGLAAGAVAGLLAVPGAPGRLAGDPRLPPPIAALIARLPDTGLAFLAPQTSPLEVAARAARRSFDSGRVAFEVNGALSNRTARRQAVAAIELRLADAAGQTVERRFIRLSEPAVAPGESASFATVALDVPVEATRVFLVVQPGPLARF